MVEKDIASAIASDLTGTMTDYSVAPASLDSPTDQKETTWMNVKWSQYLGYFKKLPELNTAINAKATWTIGKGYTASPETTLLLDTIRGNGFDTFNTILENCIRTYHIGGDSYCEIIRDKKGILINLKPLNPEVIRHVFNRKGRFIRFERVDSVSKKALQKFKPKEIFYLARNRVADEIHGNSIIGAVEEVILMINEAMADYKKVMHRFVKPQWKFKLKTDIPAEITAYKAKQDAATESGENIYEPFDVSESELLAVAPNATLNPLTWIDSLNDKFWEAVQIPRFFNPKTFTEASSKMSYLALQQPVEEEQLFIEEQILAQLNLVIELTFPAKLENEALSDKPKKGEVEIENETAVQPNDTTVELEGRR